MDEPEVAEAVQPVIREEKDILLQRGWDKLHAHTPAQGINSENHG
jgi:hypothetical protein